MTPAAAPGSAVRARSISAQPSTCTRSTSTSTPGSRARPAPPTATTGWSTVAVQRPQRRAQVGERPRLGLVGPQRAGDEQPWLGLAAQGQEGDQAARRIGDVDDGTADVQGEAADEGELDRSLGRVRHFRLPRLLAHRRCDDGAAGRWISAGRQGFLIPGGSGGGFRDGRRRRRSRGGRVERRGTERGLRRPYLARRPGASARVSATPSTSPTPSRWPPSAAPATRWCPTSSAGSVAGRRPSSPMTTNRLVPLTAR